jgi:spore germination protein (amino acid permease)
MSAVLTTTPNYAIMLFMLIPCCYSTFKGLECIGRAAVSMSIFVFFIFLIYAVLNLNNMDFKVFLPILSDSSISNIAFGTFNYASRFCDCFLFFLFIPYVKKKEALTVTKILIIAVSVFTFMNILLTVVTQAVLGVELAKIMKFPYYSSIQQISLFNIIQRIEFFNVIGWIIIMFFKLSATVLAAAMVMAQMLNVKSYKVFVIPINLINFFVIFLTNISDYDILQLIIKEYAHVVIFIMNFIIPFTVLIVYFFRRKKLFSILEKLL